MENRRRAITAHVADKIAALVSRLKVNEPLKDHTTFRIGGPAKYFAEVSSTAEFSGLYRFSLVEHVPFFVLGGGANVLFGERGFDGIVARLTGELSEHHFEGEKLYAGAGARLGVLVKESAERGLSGMECLAGVPSTLGGALMSNAGARDEWIGGLVATVDVVRENGTISSLDRQELSFSYRASSLAGRPVTGATLNLKKGSKNDILNRLKNLMLRRTQSQPAGTWNAGSVFRNPPDDSAGRLIEACGLKGLAFGGAKVSEKHANFIVNTGNATSADVRSLIALVRQRVKERFDVELTLEINIVGE